MKKFSFWLTKLLALVVGLAIICFSGCSDTQTPDSSSDGDSTPIIPSETVEITTEEELFAIADDLNGSYKLLNDITLTKSWKTLGNSATPFTGIFDGNGHTIYAMNVESDVLYVDDTSIKYMVGMFGVLKGDMQNLTVDSLTVNVSADTIADTNYAFLLSQNNAVTNLDIHVGLVGLNEGDIENVCVNVDFDVIPETTTARIRIGGIAGKSDDYIENCKVNGNINVKNIDGYIRAGGIVGYVSSNGKVISNQAHTDINAEITGGAKMQLGGVVGNIECGTVNDCYATGTVTGTNTATKATLAGGLIGLIDNTDTKYEDMSVTVNGSYANVNVTITGSKGYAAGFIGQIEFDNTVTIANNGSLGTASGEKASYGFVGRIQTLLGTTLTISDFTNGAYGGKITFTENKSIVADNFATQVETIEIPNRFITD